MRFVSSVGRLVVGVPNDWGLGNDSAPPAYDRVHESHANVLCHAEALNARLTAPDLMAHATTGGGCRGEAMFVPAWGKAMHGGEQQLGASPAAVPASAAEGQASLLQTSNFAFYSGRRWCRPAPFAALLWPSAGMGSSHSSAQPLFSLAR